MGDRVELRETREIPDDERLLGDRPDFTSEESNINVDVDIQSERIEAITIADSEDPITSDGYASTWWKTGEFAYVRGFVQTNVAGTIYIDQSRHGANVDVTTDQVYEASALNGGFVENLTAPFVRIRFVPTTSGTDTFLVWARLSME